MSVALQASESAQESQMVQAFEGVKDLQTSAYCYIQLKSLSLAENG